MTTARGEVQINLGGVERKLTPSYKAITALESAMGEPMLDIVDRMTQKKFAAKDIVCLVWAGLLGSGEKITIEEVGDLVLQEGIVTVFKPLTEFINQLCTGGRTTAQDPK